jgi:hypothetical protein
MNEDTIIRGTRLQEVLRDKVHSAMIKQDVEVSDVTEYYLVNLLDEFQHAGWLFRRQGSGLIERPLAILLLEAMSKEPQAKIQCLKQVGDTSLIVLGFFADNVRRRIMAPSYYSSMGESAYLSLAGLMKDHQTFAPLYGELADKFDHFVDVLACVAPWNRPDSDAELLRIYERWLVTGDANLKELLERKGISTDDAPPTLKQQ